MSQNIEIQFLGTGDAFGSGGKGQTCFYATYADKHFLIDCGATALVNIQKYNVPMEKIDTIFITHFHGDHFGGLPFFLLASFLVQKRETVLSIVGPKGIEKKVKNLMEALYEGTSSKLPKSQLKFVEYQPLSQQTINEIHFTAFPVVHSPNSAPHGIRIEIGSKKFAYSGDTEWTETLLDLASETDYFIVECNSFQEKVKYHLTYKELLENRKRFTCRNMMLTHLGEDMFDHLSSLRIPYAKDGMSIIF